MTSALICRMALKLDVAIVAEPLAFAEADALASARWHCNGHHVSPGITD